MKVFNKQLKLLVALFIATSAIFSCERGRVSFGLGVYVPHPCIREYEPADKDQARKILVENDLAHSLTMPSCLNLVYQEASEIKGVCIANTSDGYIYRIAAGKNYQRQGIGTALLHDVMHRLHQDYEIKEFSLHSEPGSVGFYTQKGFSIEKGSLKCRIRFA